MKLFHRPCSLCRRHSESATSLEPLSPVAGRVSSFIASAATTISTTAAVSTATRAVSCGSSVIAAAATAAACSSVVCASARTSGGTRVIASGAASRAAIVSTAAAVVASEPSAAPRFRRAWRYDGLVQLQRGPALPIISAPRRRAVVLTTAGREAIPSAPVP